MWILDYQYYDFNLTSNGFCGSLRMVRQTFVACVDLLIAKRLSGVLFFLCLRHSSLGFFVPQRGSVLVAFLSCGEGKKIRYRYAKLWILTEEILHRGVGGWWFCYSAVDLLSGPCGPCGCPFNWRLSCLEVNSIFRVDTTTINQFTRVACQTANYPAIEGRVASLWILWLERLGFPMVPG